VLNVEVRDDGRGLVAAGAPPSRGSGFGLVGMQQRAALLRGRLRAGECESGGFLVTAELPLSPGT
jgi:signal transduction histidine kinase